MLASVARGETLTITRDGEPVANIGPLPRKPLSAEQLAARWRHIPRIDADQLRSDLDEILDPAL